MRYKGMLEHAESQTTNMEGHYSEFEVSRNDGHLCTGNRVHHENEYNK